MNALLLAALMAVSPAAQNRAREVQPPDSMGTAVIRGRVTELDSGRPLPRFRVTLSTRPLSDDNSGALDTVLTAADGSYQFPAVRPGRYLITVRPPEHVATHLPQMYGHDDPRPVVSVPRVRPVDLEAGDTFEANIAIRRSLAIEGRVMTEEGDPLSNVVVSLERLDRGVARTAVSTDDRGYYRHYGVAPGRYRVCATPAATTDPISPSNGPAAALKTCVPSDVSRGDTATLDVTTADVSDANVIVRRDRGVTVSGTVIDSHDRPLEHGELSFVQQNDRRSLRVERAEPGRFVVRDVEPGTYTLRADVRPQTPADAPRRESGALEIAVDRSDIGSVVLRTRRVATISGVVTFEGGAPESHPENMTVTMRTEPASDTTAPDVLTPRSIRENLTFELITVSEPVRLGVNQIPSGWIVRSILYRGRDIADDTVTLEASDDPRAIEIVLTNRVAFITGSVAGSTSSPVIVLAFRADKIGNPSSGEAAPVAGSVLVDERSGFKLGPLEPADYYVAAVDRNQWFDATLRNRAATISSLIARAVRVVAAEGDRRAIALRVVPVRQ